MQVTASANVELRLATSRSAPSRTQPSSDCCAPVHSPPWRPFRTSLWPWCTEPATSANVPIRDDLLDGPPEQPDPGRSGGNFLDPKLR
jgi:hypothetical protein